MSDLSRDGVSRRTVLLTGGAALATAAGAPTLGEIGDEQKRPNAGADSLFR